MVDAVGGHVYCFGQAACDMRGCPENILCPDNRGPNWMPYCSPTGRRCPVDARCSNYRIYECDYEYVEPEEICTPGEKECREDEIHKEGNGEYVLVRFDENGIPHFE